MSKPRLNLLPLEDRCTPASFVGTTITLDDGGEVLTISTSTSGEYILSSTVDVNGETGPVVFTPEGSGPISVMDTVNSTSVLFANSTAEYAHAFNVELNDGSQGVRFDGASAFGTNNLSVTVDRHIAVNPLALVSTTTGSIALAANMQTAARIGEFIGVDVQGKITATDTGSVSVQGRGGLFVNSYGLFGVQVLGTAAIISTGTGTLTATGTGGGGSGDASIGVHVAGGAKIASGTASILVTGNGGGGAGQGNYGVLVQNANSAIYSDAGNVTVNGSAGTGGTKSYAVGVYLNDFGSVTTRLDGTLQVTGLGGGTGNSAHNNGVFVVSTSSISSDNGNFTLSGTGGGGSGGGSMGVHVAEGGGVSSGKQLIVTGTGGTGTGDYNVGVMVQGLGSVLSSPSGTVIVEGTSGANGQGNNIGVMVYNGGKINTDGIGTVVVKGTGKGPINGRNYGVFVIEEGAEIFSNGLVSIEGIAPTSGNVATEAVFVSNNGSITSTSSVTINADALSIDSNTGSISAGIGTVTLQPRTTGLKISLGGSGTPILNLLTAELARITAGTLVIGNSGAGEIRITGPVSGMNVIPRVQLVTGGDIVSERNSTLYVGSAELTLAATGFIQLPTSNSDFRTYSAGITTLATGSRVNLPINGVVPDQYGRLDVDIELNLNNAVLTLSGNYVPLPGNVFTLVNTGKVTGTFANTPDNTVMVFNGKSLRINYTTTSVTATVV
jgi:hypothetical protein